MREARIRLLDAGTRVGRFMLQDALGHVWKPFAETSWYPSVLIASGLVVAGWGYFLYIGVVDPNGGINILWPLFGLANQLLAGIALCVASGILVKQGKLRYVWVTAAPLAWLAIVTTTASWQKIVSPDVRIGFLFAAEQLAGKLASGALPPEQAGVAPQLIFNQRLDAALAMLLTAILWVVIADTIRVSWRVVRGRPVLTELGSARRTPRGGPVMKQRLTLIWNLLRTLVNDDAYERYLRHHACAHTGTRPARPPLVLPERAAAEVDGGVEMLLKQGLGAWGLGQS